MLRLQPLRRRLMRDHRQLTRDHRQAQTQQLGLQALLRPVDLGLAVSGPLDTYLERGAMIVELCMDR